MLIRLVIFAAVTGNSHFLYVLVVFFLKTRNVGFVDVVEAGRTSLEILDHPLGAVFDQNAADRFDVVDSHRIVKGGALQLQ